MKTNFIFLLTCLALSVFFFNPSGSQAFDNRSEKVEQYISRLQSASLFQKIQTAKEITNSGLTSPRLFGVVNKELLDNYENSNKKEHIDYMSWLCKALASSGLAQYKSTLEKVAASTANLKLQRYANQSLDLFEEYSERNRIMADDTYASSSRDPEVTRLINMLKSEKMKLKRDAAKVVTRNNYSDPFLYEVINDELLKWYQSGSDNLTIDAMAWLCKALASSGIADYKKTLQEIITSSHNLKLIKYAEQSHAILDN